VKQQIHDVKEQEQDEEKEHLNEEVDTRILEKQKKKGHSNA
jgi:hypothetical protein